MISQEVYCIITGNYDIMLKKRQGDVMENCYSNIDNWLAFPGAGQLQHTADVFYLYPTMYAPKSTSAPLVCDISDNSMRKGARYILKRQATVFDTVADIYAPFYKQLQFGAFHGNPEDVLKLRRKAAQESVFLALDYYFENCNNGRPFFLLGHSQGSAVMAFILEEYIQQHPKYFQNMVAAYMVGLAPTRGWLEDNPHIKFAQGADDTGVLVSWNTEAPGNVHQFSIVIPKDSIAINPLNWRTDEMYAGLDQNLGSLVRAQEGGFQVGRGIADARLDLARGSVIVESLDPALFAVPPGTESSFGNQSFHMWDIELFYMNIRQNARLRLERFLSC